MLNLHQWYFKNIGPLKEKSVLINYLKKNLLIKAPIWTWKSFLFFDWPIFWLYKYSERTIINKSSKSWEINLIFSVDNRYFLIIRKLAKTKSWKDSTKTMFWEIENNKNFIDYLNSLGPIFSYQNKNLLQLLKQNNVKLNDLTSDLKENDIQQLLNDLLPPKEVALSTIFLPQNSENIFEMKPAERITVLKKVFWIIWIDEAKKKIDEEKTKVYWQLKSLENVSMYEERIIEILKQINQLDLNIAWLKSFFSDLDLFSFENFSISKASKLKVDFDKEFEIIKEKQHKYKDFEKNIQFLNNQIKETTNELDNINLNLQQIEKQLKEISNLSNQTSKYEWELKNIEEKIQQIEKKYDNIQQTYENVLKIKENIKTLQKELLTLKKEKESLIKLKQELQAKLSTNVANHITNLNNEIEKKSLKLEELKNIDFQKFKFNEIIPDNIASLKELILKVETDWKSYNLEIQKLKTQLENTLKNLSILESKETTEEFHCEKIWDNCPFVKDIKKRFDKSFAVLQEQKNELLNQKNQLEKEINSLTEKITYLRNWWKENNISQLKLQLQEIEKLQQDIWDLHKELKTYKNKQDEIMQLKWQYDQIIKQIEKTDSELSEKNQKLKQLEDSLNEEILNDYKVYQSLKLEKEKLVKEISNLSLQLSKTLELQGKKQQFEDQKVKLEKKIADLKKDLQSKQNEFEKIKEEYEKSLKDESKLIKLKELVWIYNNVLDEYNKNKIELQKVKRRYKILKDLSSIFGKELVIYVFSDYLKSLEDLINSFIWDVVSFRLYIRLDEEKWDKLDIFVEDNLWQRPVSSLSWWQKTALRIGWILAISKLKGNKMLFLDETINNFDQEAVNLLAQTIKEFITENDMKFYMITHSEILQQMSNWDEILELPKL